MKLSLFLFATLFPFLTFAEEEKLWPPRGNNRPLIAATQALWWNKDDPEARKLKARALDFAGRYAEAEKAARFALLVAPQDPEVQRILGRSLLHQGKLAQAKSALERAGQLGDPLSRSLASLLRPDRMSLGNLDPKISRSLVQIQDDQGRGIGSGSFVSSNGIVLTAAHVVAGRKRVLVRNAWGQILPAKSICPGDFSADAVLLQTSAQTKNYLVLADHDPAPHESLTVSGFPLSIDLPLTSRGQTRSKAKDGILSTTIPLMPGQSGSPVLNAQNQIVGLASRGSLPLLTRSAPARSEAVANSALTTLWDSTRQKGSFFDIRQLPQWTDKNTFFDPAVSSAEQTVLDQNFAESEKAITQVIDQHPRDAGLLLRRALTRIALNHIPEAEADIRLAARLEPKNPEPRRLLTGLLLQTGRGAAATQEMEIARQLDPDDADTAEELAEIYLSQGLFAKALSPAEEATRLNPESCRAWSILSAAQLATGHLADARQAAETATQRGPEDPRAWIQLAASLNAAHDFSTAKTAAEQATQLAPGEARAWLNLATAYAGLDEYRDAIPHAEKATQLEPKNRAGWNLLAALYRELNRTEEADAASTRARALDLPPTDR
ncbi:MAG: tetratricopeptide repeat protein [Verrucomicrobia bacterium]|nr:tetratricopeptide repeat protein [Verrucomicrobiota bacterium]